jgi:hypothetical protein
MLNTPGLLVSALAPEDNLVALNNARALAVADLLLIESEQMSVSEVVSANNYKVIRDPAAAVAHAAGAAVWQMPNPNDQNEISSDWLAPPALAGVWLQIAGVWTRGSGVAAP